MLQALHTIITPLSSIVFVGATCCCHVRVVVVC